MNILVTGGAGYIGSHVVLQLRERDHCVVVCDDLSNSFKEAVIGAEFYELDIADSRMEDIFKQYRFDAVMHFAASISVPESVRNPCKYYMNNTVATFKLLELCTRYRITSFILSSTAAVYGIPATIPVDENSPLKPINAYGHSKLMCERLVVDIARQARFKYAILRYFNVSGADMQARIGENNKEAAHLIKIACMAAINRSSKMDLYGTDYETEDGTCVRDYIHVLDIADAHLCALDYLSEGGESDIFNCGYGHGYSVKDILETVKRVGQVNFKVVETDRREGDPPELIASNDKIKRVLEWKARYDDIGIIVQSALAWERKLASE